MWNALVALFSSEKPKEFKEYTAEVRQGKRGRWRWILKDSDGKLVAVAPVNPGESSEFAATQRLKTLFDGTGRIVKWKVVKGEE